MKSRILTLVAGTLLLAGATVQATVTDNFAGLLTELQSRSQALSNFVSQAGLSNSVKKVAVTQLKACDKSIKTINKVNLITNSTATAKGLIVAGQVASALRKPFADELANTNVHFHVGNFTSTHNLRVLLSDTFTAFADDVEDQLGDVDLTGITGTALAKIEAAIAKANAALHDAGLETDFAKATRFLSNALKSTLSAVKAAIAAHNHPSGGGGGGGGTGAAGMHAKINGASFASSGLVTLGTFTGLTGEFTVTGTQLSPLKSVTIIATGVNGPGTYTLTAGIVNDIGNGINFASNVTGTMHIATFNLAQQKATGTFSFSSSQSTPVLNPNNKVNVTAGTFNISQISGTGF